MRSLSDPFIRRPVLTVLLTISMILFGVMAFRQLPWNDLPAVDYPVIQVSVNYPGASPETMANNIATPLEKQFMQISGLDLVTSKSSQGFCSLTLQFNLSKSVDAAATDVQTAISQATGSLPTDLPAPPTFSKTNPNDQAVLYIALTSDSVTAARLYDYASTNIGQRIAILSGVSKVAVYGTKSAIRIKADPSLLAARNLSIDDLTTSVRNATVYSGAGQFDDSSQSLVLNPNGQIDTVEGYNQIIIGSRNGTPIYLRDVATAKDTVQDERIDMRFWARGYKVPTATVVMAVFRQAGANAVEVAASVKKLVPQIQAEIPGSVRIIPIYDRSQTIVNSVKDVSETLCIAFVLVIIVIFVFLGRVADTLIPVVALPLSILLTLIVMRVLGYSIDNLSLMALTLAIGFLVDDAIVFLENTVRRMEHGENVLQATFHSAREISFTILSMTLSLAAVFLPMVFMPGLIGRIFNEFAVTIIVAIFASGVVSLTVTPLMCSRLLKGRGPGHKKSFVERVIGAVEKRVLGAYGKSLWFFLKHRWISLVIWFICLAGTGILFYEVPKAFLPIGDSGFIRGIIRAQEGASPRQMRQYQNQVEEVLHANPAVGMTFTMTGNAQFLSSSDGLVLAFLDDYMRNAKGQLITAKGEAISEKGELLNEKGEPVANSPKQEPVKRPPIQMVAGQLMMAGYANPGFHTLLSANPVLQISVGATANLQGQFAYSLSGSDPQLVYSSAERLMAKLYDPKGYNGFAFISSDYLHSTPQLEITPLRDEAASYGVSVSRILALLRSAYSQNYVYLIKHPQDQYQVIIETRDSERSRAEDLKLLYIRSDDGKRTIPLSAIATWKETLGLQAVNHINQFTAVTLFFNLKPNANIGEATDYIEKCAKEVVPISLRASLQGEAQTFKETIPALVILMLLAVFIMYVILGILYESYLHPITVLSTLPVALIGGLASLFIFNIVGFALLDHKIISGFTPAEASLYAFIGMFMLMGIVKKNGILIVDFAIQRVAEGQEDKQAIHDASMDRFRPIVMTTFAALMGALPIALGIGADGASRRPLGLVIVGGLIVSQFITLYVTPVIYLYLEDFQEHVLDKIAFLRSTRTHHELLEAAEKAAADDPTP